MPLARYALSLALPLLAACSAPSSDPSQETPGVPAAVQEAPDPAPVPPGTDATTPPSAEDASASTPTTAAPCDWQDIALPEHRSMVAASADVLLGKLADAGGDAGQLRPLLARPTQPLGRVEGQWQVRTLLYDRGMVFAYPFFAARIVPDDCGHAIAKTTGSQRFSGVLYPVEGDADRLAFLGATTVNDDPPLAYDPKRPASSQRPGEENSAGVLSRIGADELLILLNAGDHDRFQVYHLRR